MNRIVRVFLPAALAFTVWLGVGPRAGHAAISPCRTDPLVTLSNTVQITLHEQIYDSSNDVTGIAYQLHVPKGVFVLSVIYYGAVPANLQKLTVYADEPPGTYDGYTTVSTGTTNIPVVAYMSSDILVSTFASGYSGQSLHNYMKF